MRARPDEVYASRRAPAMRAENFSRSFQASYLPFIGGFARLDFPTLPATSLNTRISSLNPSLNKSDRQRTRPDYRPVKLFGKVVAINFGRG